jgi:hypothetical protein
MDAKATVRIGPCSRRGRSRGPPAAADHDCQPAATGTPLGLRLPALAALFRYGVTSRVTSAGLGDRLTAWWESVRGRFSPATTLVLNLDNGPEHHRHRTPFMPRLVPFARRFRLTVRLAYDPPYHRKDHPAERCWGILERHWHGGLRDSVEATRHFAAPMTRKGRPPLVALVATAYHRGVRPTAEARAAAEAQRTRLPGLERWVVDSDGSALAAGET